MTEDRVLSYDVEGTIPATAEEKFVTHFTAHVTGAVSQGTAARVAQDLALSQYGREMRIEKVTRERVIVETVWERRGDS